METIVTKEVEKNIVKVIGRVDTVTSAEFQNAISPLCEEDKDLELDCEQMEYIASSGLRVFLTAFKQLNAKGRQLQITHIQANIMQVLKMTGFDKFLNLSEA
ncbi:MAG: STAS domain-containing protein [Bacteroidaceae bacterium]|nr:STAS domain-containing protein [Bacteroidaceae bacterium]